VLVSRTRRLRGEAESSAGKNLWARARPAATRLAVEADGKAEKSHLVPPWRNVQARGSEERNFSKSHRAKNFKVPPRVVVENEIFQSPTARGSGG
jgi:hypothetical protein